jgi:hypothetical protein
MFRELRDQEMLFLFLVFCCTVILISQLNWNRREDLIERAVLKSFPVGCIHVKVKVSFH